MRTPTPAMCRKARWRFQAAENGDVREGLPVRGPADEPGCLGGGVRSRGQLSHLQVRPGCVANCQGLSGLMPLNQGACFEAARLVGEPEAACLGLIPEVPAPGLAPGPVPDGKASERIAHSNINPNASGNQTRPSRVKAAAPPPLTTLSSRRPRSIHEIDRPAGVASGVALAASTQDSPALSADA